MPDSPAQGYSPFKGYRWVICGLLFFATTISYIDRQILGLLKDRLDAELHWTNTQYGWANSAFQITYGVVMLFFGALVDKIGTRLGYAISFVVWGLSALGYGLVHSIEAFIFGRVAIGAGEAGNFPCAIKATALWFPKRERAFSTTIFNSGANVAGVIAPAIIPFIADRWGWRGAYMTAGTLALCWVALWLIFYEIPERMKKINPEELAHIKSDLDEQAQERKLPWSSIMGYPQAWSFIVAKFLTDPIWWFFLIWLPDYFKKTRSLDIKHSWLHIITIYSIVTVLSIFGGWVTGRMSKIGWTITRARKTMMFICALCVLPILSATTVGDWTAVVFIGLAGAAHQAWSANLFSTTSDMFPKKAIAGVVGIGGLAGAFGGFLFPIFAGWLLDTFEKSGRATTAYTILFGICGSAYLIAFALNHLLAPKFEQVKVDILPS
jgi:MFS transporter, ACS family, hexuronate transporter